MSDTLAASRHEPPGRLRLSIALAQFLVGFLVTSIAVAGFATCAAMATGLANEMNLMLAKIAG